MVSAMARFGNRKEDFSIVLLWHIIQHGTLQSLQVLQRLLTLSDLSSSFTSPAGVSWLLGFLVVLVSVLVTARPEGSAASR